MKRSLGRVLVVALGCFACSLGAAYPSGAVVAGSSATSPAAEAEFSSLDLCQAFTMQEVGNAAAVQAVIGWASAALRATCTGGPTTPPDGDACVSRSSFLQECLDCCVYNGQTLLACANKCFIGFPPIPVLPHPFPNPPANPQEQCCADWCKVGGGFGLSSCCNGAPLSCDCTPAIRPNDPTLQPLMDHLTSCVQQCEGLHQNNYHCVPGVRDPQFNYPACGQVCSECTVNRCFVRCMSDFDCPSSGNPAACQAIQDELRANRDQFCTDCTKCLETHK